MSSFGTVLRLKERWTVLLGVVFVALGLLVNRYTVGHLASDGTISGWHTNLAILAFQAVMLSVGASAVLRRRGPVLELTLLGASLAIGVLALEVLWRFYLFGWSSLSYDKMNSLHALGQSGMLRASQHLGVVFELRPNLDQTYKLVPFRTNSMGMRDAEVKLEKPTDGARVAVLGDSYTMGTGVRYEDMYATRLEVLLQEESDHPVEVLNFGVGFYSLTHYLAVIEEKVLPFDPDLIIIGFCAQNDFRPPVPPQTEEGFRVMDRKGWFWKSHVLRFLEDLRREGQSPEASPEQIEYVSDMFDAFSTVSEREGIPILIAYLTNRPAQALLIDSLATEHDLRFVNAGAEIQDGDLKSLSIYYPEDTHPNGPANHAFAEAIDWAIDSINVVGIGSR